MAMDYPPLRSVPGFSWMGINLGLKDQTLDFGVIAAATAKKNAEEGSVGTVILSGFSLPFNGSISIQPSSFVLIDAPIPFSIRSV